MTRYLPAAFAIALSLAALIVVVARTESNPTLVDGLRSNEDLQVVKDEVRALTASMKELRLTLEGLKAHPPMAAPDPAMGAGLAEFGQKMDLIARRLAEIEARLEMKVADPANPPAGNDAARLQAQVTDATKTSKERVVALGKLRDEAPESRAAVVESMAALLGTCDDAGVRADVIRQMHGIDSPVLKQAVLLALTTDADARVREQAAKDLDTWREDADVRAALEAAKTSDASDKVRKHAAKTLEED